MCYDLTHLFLNVHLNWVAQLIANTVSLCKVTSNVVGTV